MTDRVLLVLLVEVTAAVVQQMNSVENSECSLSPS